LLFDERGIVILSGILLASTYTLIYSDSVVRTGIRFSTFFLVIWGAAASSLHWIARPHLFTMFFLAIWLVWSERLASGKKIPLWYFPALMFLWNNLHGEYIAGLLVTIACLAGWVWEYIFHRAETDVTTGKRIGLVLFMSILVSVLNPISFQALSTVISWMDNSYLMSHTQETVPPDFSQPSYLILLGLIIFSFVLLVIKRMKIPARHTFLLLGFTVMVLFSARNVHLYGIVAPFVLAGMLKGSLNVPFLQRLETLMKKFENPETHLFWYFVGGLSSVILLAFTSLGTVQRFSPSFFPVSATEWLDSHPQEGRMFNTFDAGGYLCFHLWPEELVFVDSQGDVYGEAFLREYEKIVGTQEGWQDVLLKYQVEFAVVPSEWRLVTALEDEGWQEIYFDSTTTILRREQYAP